MWNITLKRQKDSKSKPCCLNYILVGDGSVGLINAYLRKEFVSTYFPTISETTAATVMVEGKSMKINFHDTAGQFEFEDIRKRDYIKCDPKRTIVLFCYDAH